MHARPSLVCAVGSKQHVPMSETPVIKASYFQGNIDALSVLGAHEAEARQRLQSIIKATVSASRADWLPMEWDYELTRVVNAIGGRDAVIELSRRSFLAAVEGPLLRPLVQGALRVFGVGPRAVLKLVSNAWGAGTKDAGVMTAVATDTGAVVRHTVIVAEPIWHEAFIGVFAGAFEVTGYVGTTIVTLEPPSAARFACSWSKLQS